MYISHTHTKIAAGFKNSIFCPIVNVQSITCCILYAHGEECDIMKFDTKFTSIWEHPASSFGVKGVGSRFYLTTWHNVPEVFYTFHSVIIQFL